MPRYFFDIHDGSSWIDEDGIECADLREARRQAIRAAGAILKDQADVWSGEVWKMEVYDERRSIVATLTFIAS